MQRKRSRDMYIGAVMHIYNTLLCRESDGGEREKERLGEREGETQGQRKS